MGEIGKYKNKLFSILGDSISTLDGYSVPRDAAFYEGMYKLQANVFTPKDTWWGQVIDRLGGELLVNDSFSGSTVCRRKGCEIPSYGCSDERTANLHRQGHTPDVVMVFMGTNDWGYGVKPTADDGAEGGDPSIFSVAYAEMLKKLQRNYPQSEIWCFTIPVSNYKKSEGVDFPYCYGGIHIDEYCRMIRACATEHRCRIVDLNRYAQMYDTVDGFHPNANGMKTISDAVIDLVQREDF